MLRALITLAVLAVATHATADTYQLVDFGKSGADLIDQTTISHNGAIIEYQDVFVIYKPLTSPDGENSYSIGHSKIDCQNNKIELIDSTGYDDRGKEVYGVPILPTWESISARIEYKIFEEKVCRSVNPKDILFTGDLHTVIGAVRAAHLAKKR